MPPPNHFILFWKNQGPRGVGEGEHNPHIKNNKLTFSLSILGKCLSATSSIFVLVQTLSSSSTNLSWNNLRASWAQSLTRPSTSRVSRGRIASHIPRTHLEKNREGLNWECNLKLPFIYKKKWQALFMPINSYLLMGPVQLHLLRKPTLSLL